MEKVNKATKVLAKIVEIAHWIGAVGMLVGVALTVLMGSAAIYGEAPKEIVTYGFEMALYNAAGEFSMAQLRFFLVVGAILMALMAMVFRNIHLIMKKSEGATPFQKDNVRMVREIGIFLIAQPVVGLIASVAAKVAFVEAEPSVQLSGIVMGLVMLSLSQFFAHGMALEADVDGLV